MEKRVLLFAPPATGKSFLLRRRAAEILSENQNAQILFLSPETGLIFELEKKLREIFPEEILATFHGKISESQKAENFWKIKTGAAKIVCGSRSALFLPFENLAAIFVEEFHDGSFKNPAAPRFRTERAAELLAENFRAQLVFSSATPTFEKFFAAQNGRFFFTKIDSKNLPKQKVEIVDLKNEIGAKNFSPLSRILCQKLAKNFAENKKAILFLNRRGLNSAMVCRDCGESLRCHFCRVALAHHHKNNENFLLCHQCSRVFRVPEKCPNCRGVKLKFFGFGSQKIETILQEKFPNAKIFRADGDTKNLREVLENFFASKNGILIGTQIVTKSFDDAEVGLVAAILADADWQIPDFRSNERAFANLTQLAGRVARGGGEVVFQTLNSRNNLISDAAAGDFEKFFTREIEIREKFFLPPFSRGMKLIFANSKKEISFSRARTTAQKIQKFLHKPEKVFVAPALSPRKFGKFFVHVLLFAKNPREILRKVNLAGARVDFDPTETV